MTESPAGLRRSYLAFNAALGDLYSDDLLRLADVPDSSRSALDGSSKNPDFGDTAFFDAAGMVYNAGGFDASQLSTPEARRLIAETLKQINRAILHNTTLPPSDPFWEMYLPPNGWNCRCTAVQVRKGKYPQSDPALAMLRGNNCTEAAKQQIFRFNPGKTLQLFPPKHPYYKAPEAAKEVIEQLSEEQQREYIARRRREIRQFMFERLEEPLENSEFKQPVRMSGKSVKEFLNQPHKHYREKNELLMDIKRVFKSAHYLGVNPIYKAQKLKFSHIFEIELCGEKSWLVVREYEDGKVMLYSCSDNPIIATGLIKAEEP